jgi:hypothetical protein
VHDRQQVLDEFLLRGQRLLIADWRPRSRTHVWWPAIRSTRTHTAQPIPMCHHDRRHLAGDHLIEQPHELAASESSNLPPISLTHSDTANTTGKAELRHRRDLRRQIVTLPAEDTRQYTTSAGVTPRIPAAAPTTCPPR